MEALVADRYTHNNNVFLAGDAAHAYPPSGGFGLNTGIGDAFCLAHKLASGLTPDTAVSYNKERRLIGALIKDFAMINFQKSLNVASKLGLHQSNAKLLTSVVSNVFSNTFLGRMINPTEILNQGVKVGLSVSLRNSKSCADFIE
jgi:2-polyprenyl-6-methoxyphenol hydroxylase-like FAD-dependent oxidoreductase